MDTEPELLSALSPVGLLLLEPFEGGWRCAHANPAATRLLEQTKVVGRSLADLLPSDTVDQLNSATEVLVQLPPRWLLLTPQRADTWLVVSIADVSRQQAQLAELQRQHRDLEVRADKLQRSNEDLEQFAYVASHDLQEPLRKIMSFGERLNKRYAAQLEGDGQMFIERMGEAAKRMEQLIDDLLAYSRATRRDQLAEPTDLQECLTDALADLEVAIERSGATVTLPQSALPTVHAVPSQMRQVLLNLLGNALKFVRPGVPPHIQIEHFERPGGELGAWAATHHLQYCVVKISDNGIGFSPDNAERIFKVFQRLHGRSEYKGSGIGLSICKKIIENYGGFIVADSQPGEGATFTFGLPL